MISKSNSKNYLFLFQFLSLLICLTSISDQPNILLYTSDYFLLPYSDKIMISINQSSFTKSNNGSMNYFKITAHIQILASNGSFINYPYQTANILVKYWKNQRNTPATSVFTYSYESISTTKQFKFATDQVDQGIVDIQALHNYENYHNFVHIVGNQTSDTLFVLGVYRYANSNLSDLLGMSTKNDQIKISVSVYKATSSQLRCPFCSVKTFCPTNQCECYQESYSDCRVKKKNIIPKVDTNPSLSDFQTIAMGTINYIQIEPDITSKEWFFTLINLHFIESSGNNSVKKENIFFLMFTQNKSQPSYMIPNIYNYDVIDSPSFPSKLTSSSYQQYQPPVDSSNIKSVSAISNGLYLSEKVVLHKDQILTAAIYYVKNSNQQTSQTNQLNVTMDMIFTTQQQASPGSSINLAFVIGMIALGFFILLLIICILHYMVARRFSIFSIFMNSQLSNRTSIYSGRVSRRSANLSQQITTLPQISFDFIKQLVFKPLKYINSQKLQQKLTSNAQSQKLSSHNEVCSICLQDFTNQSRVKYTYCGHILDAKCLQQWFQKQLSCPLCRQKLQPDEILQYEDKIMLDICENDYYQTVLNDETNTLKRIYKDWNNKKSQRVMVSQINKYTEQSLVQNNQIANNYIQNTIQNISTMVELQKTHQNLNDKQMNDRQNKDKQNNDKQIIGLNNNEQISYDNMTWLFNIFNNNMNISMKRLLKIYRFYRCIYLYHVINKRFEKDNNLFEPSLYFEQKDNSIKQHQLNNDHNNYQINNNNKIDNIMIQNNNINISKYYIQTQKCQIKRKQSQTSNNRQQVINNKLKQQNYNNRQQQQQISANINTQSKLKSTTSLKQINTKRYIRKPFRFDFQFNQLEQHLSNIQPIIQQTTQPALIRQNTNNSYNSHNTQNQYYSQNQHNSIQHQHNSVQHEHNSAQNQHNSAQNQHNKRQTKHNLVFDNKVLSNNKQKCLSMRQQMIELQRRLGQSDKRQQQMDDKLRDKDRQSVIYIQNDDQNERYLDVPIQLLSPVNLQRNNIYGNNNNDKLNNIDNNNKKISRLKNLSHNQILSINKSVKQQQIKKHIKKSILSHNHNYN